MGREEDEVFGRMQGLLDRLPAMQAEQVRLERHHEALQIDRLAQRAEADAQELANIDDEIARVKGLLDAASGGFDAQETDRLQRLVLFLGNQRGYKTAPARNSRSEFDQALGESRFSDSDDCRAAILPPEEAAGRERALCSYRDDYQKSLAACQVVEEGSATAFSV